MSGKSRRVSRKDLGLEVVDVPRPTSSEARRPDTCPTCGERLIELRTDEEQIDVGDGHSYTFAHLLRGHCPECGWVDV